MKPPIPQPVLLPTTHPDESRQPPDPNALQVNRSRVIDGFFNVSPSCVIPLSNLLNDPVDLHSTIFDNAGREGRVPLRSKNSSGFAVVVFQEPTESLTTLNGSVSPTVVIFGKQDHVPFALMWTFLVKVTLELTQSSTQ